MFTLSPHNTVGASSQCYCDELMLLKCELIKMPDQHKYELKWISASYKMFRRGIEILILSFNYLKKKYLCLRIFRVKFVSFTTIFN